jgi:hypothetical protein
MTTVHVVDPRSERAGPTIGDRPMEEFLALLAAELIVLLAQAVLRQLVPQIPFLRNPSGGLGARCAAG